MTTPPQTYAVTVHYDGSNPLALAWIQRMVATSRHPQYQASIRISQPQPVPESC